MRRALQSAAGGALFIGSSNIQSHQPRCRGIDGHGCVHLCDRDGIEQSTHIPEMGDGHADFAHFATSEHMIGIVPRLGWQIESDREARLAFSQIGPVQAVRVGRRRVAGIGPKNPGFVGLWGSGGHMTAPGAA